MSTRHKKLTPLLSPLKSRHLLRGAENQQQTSWRRAPHVHMYIQQRWTAKDSALFSPLSYRSCRRCRSRTGRTRGSGRAARWADLAGTPGVYRYIIYIPQPNPIRSNPTQNNAGTAGCAKRSTSQRRAPDPTFSGTAVVF